MKPHSPSSIIPRIPGSDIGVLDDAAGIDPAADPLGFCPRTESFTLPGSPGIQITAVEDGGSIDFTVTPLGTAVTLGLFFQFNDAKLGTLQVTGGEGVITRYQIGDDNVIDSPLGPLGAPGPGIPGGQWDVGIAIREHSILPSPVHFTLTDAAHDLTLDDFAHGQFGAWFNGDWISAVAPAAPHAQSDSATTHEDVPVTINVLANDTDADGSKLFIDEVQQPQHGTVTIAPDGQSVIYAPNLDYANSPTSEDDSFLYCVSDGKGGEDHATVSVHVTPVADAPAVAVHVLAPQAGDPVNEVRLEVTGSANDGDGSDYIDRVQFTGLPAGATLLGADATGAVHASGRPGSVTDDVQVLLPLNQTSKFDLGATAFADETEGNGDPQEASAMTSQPIELDFAQNTAALDFQAKNQSIWDTGNAFAFDDHRFLGIDDSGPNALHLSTPSVLGFDLGADLSLKAGFQSDLHITAGDINADLLFDITLDTLYNKTTDTLEIDPSAKLSGGHFTTEGPGGSYKLDFIFEASGDVFADGPFGAHASAGFGPFNADRNIVNLNSADLSTTVGFPTNSPVCDLTLAWPQVNTTSGAPSGNTISSHGTSNDIANLSCDLVAAALAALGISPDPLKGSILGIDYDILSFSIDGGVNLQQNFSLKALGLNDMSLKAENGALYTLDFGSLGSPGTAIPIPTASLLDTNHDGRIDFTAMGLTPNATLTNDTDLGLHVGADLKVLDVGSPINVTAVDKHFDIASGTVDLVDRGPFSLAFNAQDYLFNTQV